jgi:ankyrin repeat protein
VRILIVDGADLNAVDRSGRTPLNWACSFVNSNRICEAPLETMRVLILAGPDTQVRNS